MLFPSSNVTCVARYTKALEEVKKCRKDNVAAVAEADKETAVLGEQKKEADDKLAKLRIDQDKQRSIQVLVAVSLSGPADSACASQCVVREGLQQPEAGCRQLMAGSGHLMVIGGCCCGLFEECTFN